METETLQKIRQLEEKVDKIYISVEKTRNHFKWTMIVTLALFILPLIGLIFAVPSFISSYTNTLNSISQ
jgi:uncharacterized membrane-anchored protein